MKRDELLVLARKCGFDITVNDGVPEDIVFIDWEHPEQTHVITSQALLFAKAVAAAEREACAKVCEEIADDLSAQHNVAPTALLCAEELRTRGQQ